MYICGFIDQRLMILLRYCTPSKVQPTPAPPCFKTLKNLTRGTDSPKYVIIPVRIDGVLERQTLDNIKTRQDPSSDNLGTTIWDASVILVRYMERNPQLYSRRKLEGKTVLELGAGCGLAGMYFALQGAHVTFTDLVCMPNGLKRTFAYRLSLFSLKNKRM